MWVERDPRNPLINPVILQIKKLRQSSTCLRSLKSICKVIIESKFFLLYHGVVAQLYFLSSTKTTISKLYYICLWTETIGQLYHRCPKPNSNISVSRKIKQNNKSLNSLNLKKAERLGSLNQLVRTIRTRSLMTVSQTL